MLAYIRTPRAATPATPEAEHDRQSLVRRSLKTNRPVQTLWASRPLQIRAGRLVAVRLHGEELQVALVTVDGRQWVRADAVLTASQAERWVRTSRFARCS